MQRKLSVFLSAIIVIAMLLSIAIPSASASKNVIKEKTFITYVDPIGTPGSDTYNVYEYSGVHWKPGTIVTYSVNTKGAPSGALNAVKKAFETWDAAVSAEVFNDNVAVASSKLVGNKYDGKNVISWGRLQTGIIAQTTTWYYTSTNEIVEVGMVFNTLYRWGIDPNPNDNIKINAFDVQNIATHEAGHTLMLLDLYVPEASQLTMYGYGAYGQTYAQTLGAGDISGIQYIYP
jgi:hypothetical protein